MSMWWDLKNTLSYNALFNFVVGSRGCGKTYGFKKWAIEDFLKTGSQFVYIRRFKTEMTKKAKENFWASVAKEFPDHDLKGTPEGDYYIDGKLAGVTRFLSSAKSEEFPSVNKICFDEFIVMDTVHHNYLKDEVTFFLELYETISRMRRVRVFFFGNAVSWANPYFTFFDIKKPMNRKNISLFRDNLVLVQIANNDDYIAAKEATDFGRLTKGTDYGNYAVHNDFYSDSMVGVAKKTEKARYSMAFKIHEDIIGVWCDYTTGYIYLSRKYSPGSGVIYALTNDDHDYNTVLLKRTPKPPWLRYIINIYRLGGLFCEDEIIRKSMLEILKIVGV